MKIAISWKSVIKFFKKLTKVVLLVVSLLIILIFMVDKLVDFSTEDKVYNSVDTIPYNKVGLLLGTTKFLSDGRLNLYYKYRLEASEELYNSGKIDFILISGDNGNKEYDEPTQIKNDLITKNIPANKIYLDYAGFRTLDSIVRSKKVFGQENITVISQQFHNGRAIFIAEKKGINAIGYNAKDVNPYYGIRIRLREGFARVKMLADLILGKNAKYLGEKVDII